MGYRLNRLDEPVFMAVSKPMQTEFGIHLRLESCEEYLKQPKPCKKVICVNGESFTVVQSFHITKNKGQFMGQN